MRDRVPSKVLDNGAIRYGVYDENGNLKEYQYLKLEDEPLEEGSALNKANLLPDDVCEAIGIDKDSEVKDALSELKTQVDTKADDKETTDAIKELDDSKADAEETSKTITTLDTTSFERFCDVAYNRYELVASSDGELTLRNVFVFPFDSDHSDDNTISGAYLQRDDKIWTANNTSLLTSDMLKNSTTKVGNSISLANDTDTYSLKFTPQYSCLLTSVGITGSYNGNTTTDGSKGNFEVTLTNLTTGEVEIIKNCCDAWTYRSFYGTMYIPVDLILHIGQKYQLDIKFIDSFSDFTDVTFGGNFYFEITGIKYSGCNTTKKFTAIKECPGGILLMHLMTWGAGGTISLDWNGETVTPTSTRTITNKSGLTIQEWEYRKSNTIPETSTFTLTLTPAVDGEIELYDFNGAWL